MSCLGWGTKRREWDGYARKSARLFADTPSTALFSSVRGRCRTLWLSATGMALVAASPAFATDFTVNSDASLRAALTNAVAGDSISFTANISTASDLPAITQSITVNGNNFTLSGANSTANGNSALFVFSGTVAINNLTISQVTAQGGAGGNSAGGGAGLGGALFVGAQANVTVSNVSLLNNVAQGGNGGAPQNIKGGGGGGGLGGAGGNGAGGGGGVGNPAVGGGANGNLTGQNSGAPGAGANGGGGVAGTIRAVSTPGGGGGAAGATSVSGTNDGGAGGFGGGGGGGEGVGNGGDARIRPGNLTRLAGTSTFDLANPGAAGNGGFGGGGGAPGGRNTATGGGDGGFGGGGGAGKNAAGSGGFGAGAGDGAGGEGGGGGLGAGGAIFVQQGGTLTLAGTLSVNGNSVVGGTGGSAGAGNGSAFGSGIFLQGNSTIVFQPGAGQVQTVADVITDQNGSTLATTRTTKAPNTFALSSAQSLNLGSGGSGGITLNGPGTLVLSAVDTYTGPTTVTAGTLGVTGSIANSTVTVSSSGTVGGLGTLGGLVAQSGGTVAPGALAPFTTLNVTGNASFAAGSIFLVNINGAGQNDKLLVTGTATLTGGTVQVLAGTGITAASRFTLLTASGGVTGAFAQVTASTNLAFLTPVLSEDANDVFLSFTSTAPAGGPPAPTFPSVAVTPGQKATVAAVQALGSGPLFNAVIGQSAAGARQAFDALSGEIHATAVSAAFEDDRLPREAILDRLSQPLATPLLSVASTMTAAYASDLPTRKGPPVAPIEVRMYQPRLFDLWGQGFGDWGRGKGNGNAASFDRSTGGFIIGGDVSAIGFAGSEWRLGAAGGYTNDTVHVDQRLSSADFENVFGAIYAGASYGAVHVRAGAIYGSNSLSTSRSVVFPGFFDAESSNSGGTTAQGFGEAGYRLNLPGVSFGSFSVSHATLEPFVGAAAINIHLNGFNEIGGPAALTGLARNFDLATSTLGLRLQSNIDAPVPLTAHALLGWRRAYGDVVPSVVLAFQNASQSFSVSGVPIDRNALLVEAGFDYAVTSAAKLGIWYSGQYGERGFDNAVKAQLDVSF
ncbi:MAG: autotransporter domain-containing protein [Hyphomicrobiales bacterium]|nr:autotransporter domain-containing protein [Hyphomicrobiales bacterium]